MSILFHILAPVLTASLLFLPSTPPAQAHPHVFIESEAELLVEGDAMVGLRQTWRFDEMFTATILADYDVDDDNAFNSEELARLENEAFSNLKSFGYFTAIGVNGSPCPIGEAYDFAASVKNGELLYAFSLACSGRLAHGSTVTASNYDPEYYVDFFSGGGPYFEQDVVAGLKTSIKISEDMDNANQLFLVPRLVVTIHLSEE